MAVISGKSINELDELSSDKQAQLKATAALFPDALVDSELGEIPEGWKVGKLDNLCDLNKLSWTKKIHLLKSGMLIWQIRKMG
jgi:type I restriction enzyme S subunit